MKTFKKVLVVTIFLLSYFYSYSQEVNKNIQNHTSDGGKLYSRISIGYAFNSGIGISTSSVRTAKGLTTNNVPFSYGKGINISYGLITMFNSNLGAEFGVGGFFGGENKVSRYYPQDLISEVITYKANSFRFSPSLIFKSDLTGVSIFAKVGLMADFGKAKSKSMASGNGNTYEIQWEYSGSPGVGHTSAIGAIIRSKNGDTDFFFEVAYIGMGKSFDVGSCTSYIYNGTNILQYYDTIDKETVFVDEVNENDNTDPDKPYKYLKYKSNYNSIGINLGIIIKM